MSDIWIKKPIAKEAPLFHCSWGINFDCKLVDYDCYTNLFYSNNHEWKHDIFINQYLGEIGKFCDWWKKEQLNGNRNAFCVYVKCVI